MAKQGQYPVIFITFKDEKHSKWEHCKIGLKKIIKDEFAKHRYLLKSDILDSFEKDEFIRILEEKADYVTYLRGLKILSNYLYRFHKQKVVILIDEYDVPIQSGYLKGYYDEIIEFMRNFLSAGLKDNEHLEKAVLTGILRVAKESIFSGLNNINVCTLLSSRYSEYFGFTEEEVLDILKYYGIEANFEELKNWYNGYIFGDRVIYNPWSVLNYVYNFKDGFKPYWTNTSSNDLVKMLVTKGGAELKKSWSNLSKVML